MKRKCHISNRSHSESFQKWGFILLKNRINTVFHELSLSVPFSCSPEPPFLTLCGGREGSQQVALIVGLERIAGQAEGALWRERRWRDPRISSGGVSVINNSSPEASRTSTHSIRPNTKLSTLEVSKLLRVAWRDMQVSSPDPHVG